MELREAIKHCKDKTDWTECGQQHRQLAEWLEELEGIYRVFSNVAAPDLIDKNGRVIKNGDRVRLVLDDGETREFDVVFKTVLRDIKCYPDFEDEYTKVAITGMAFCWSGYDLFPSVDADGIPDTSKMEVINVDVYEVN